MFICLFAPPRGLAFRTGDGVPRAKLVTDQLVRLAHGHSPRIEIHGDNLVVFEVPGLRGRSGDGRELGANLRRAAADTRIRSPSVLRPHRRRVESNANAGIANVASVTLWLACVVGVRP